MTQGNTPAGWYPQGNEERFWDGTQWTAQTRPLSAPQPQYQQAYQQPPKKSHTLRNVLLVLVVLAVLFVGGCAALVGIFANEVDKAIDEEMKNDKPVAIVEGEAFDHDGFAVAGGWSVAPEQFGGTTIKNMQVTLEDDQSSVDGGRSALLTFRLYDGKNVVNEINCSSNEMQEGETSRMDCFGSDTEKTPKWDTIKVSDAW